MTKAEINLNALTHNLNEIKKHSGNKEIIAVVKANAYGHGIEIVSKHLYKSGVRYFAVSDFAEAEQIRGIVGGDKRDKRDKSEGNILLFGADNPFIEETIKNNYIQTVVSVEHARALCEQSRKFCESYGKSLRCHIKIDTGMTRFGISTPEELSEIMTLPFLKPEGLFTHFSCADSAEPSDVEFTVNQQAKFVELARRYKKECKSKGYNLKLHSQNTGGIFNHSGFGGDMVRAGLALYGYGADSLIQVMSFKSKIAQIRDVPKGTPVSYGRGYVTENDCRLAVIPAGYADGYSRLLSNKGKVLINGKLSPIRGRVCMDYIIVDVTGTGGVKVGDEAEIYSCKNKETTVEHIAEITGTIPYEVTCAVSARVTRQLTVDN